MSTKTSPAKNSEESQRDSQVKAPSITLPKGGGGIGEKFAANPVTGTESMTAPASVLNFHSPMFPALVTGRSASAGTCHYHQLPVKQTRDYLKHGSCLFPTPYF